MKGLIYTACSGVALTSAGGVCSEGGRDDSLSRLTPLILVGPLVASQSNLSSFISRFTQYMLISPHIVAHMKGTAQPETCVSKC